MDDRNFNEDKLFLIEKLQLLPQYTKSKIEGQASDKTLPILSNSNSATVISEYSPISTSELSDGDQVETESLVLSRSASVFTIDDEEGVCV